MGAFDKPAEWYVYYEDALLKAQAARAARRRGEAIEDVDPAHYWTSAEPDDPRYRLPATLEGAVDLAIRLEQIGRATRYGARVQRREGLAHDWSGWHWADDRPVDLDEIRAIRPAAPAHIGQE